MDVNKENEGRNRGKITHIYGFIVDFSGSKST
jgi:hypothetical protein